MYHSLTKRRTMQQFHLRELRIRTTQRWRSSKSSSVFRPISRSHHLTTRKPNQSRCSHRVKRQTTKKRSNCCPARMVVISTSFQTPPSIGSKRCAATLTRIRKGLSRKLRNDRPYSLSRSLSTKRNRCWLRQRFVRTQDGATSKLTRC